jgi:hypothetical protein
MQEGLELKPSLRVNGKVFQVFQFFGFFLLTYLN